jgi:hypothetical protein
MQIIDVSYFIGEINIAQVDTPAVSSRLNVFINKYVPLVLNELLGYSVAKEFLEAVAAAPGVPLPEKWADLLNGKIYQVGGVEYNWIGFANAAKQSLLANFVWYRYAVDNVNQTVGAGNVKPLFENAEQASVAFKTETVWNEAVKWVESLDRFTYENRDTYYPDGASPLLSDCRPVYRRAVNSFNL